jgi:four helix bundle protein
MENDNSKFKNEFKKRLYHWVLRLLKFVDKLPKSSVVDIIIKQLIRSATSILANYIEANSASSRKDFINFFTHSLKSSNESKVWITLLRDLDKGDKMELKWLLDELIEISKILASSIITLKGKR